MSSFLLPHRSAFGHTVHGYYDANCFLPLYVFGGERLLCAYLRPSHIDVALHSRASLHLLVNVHTVNRGQTTRAGLGIRFFYQLLNSLLCTSNFRILRAVRKFRWQRKRKSLSRHVLDGG